MQWKQQPVWNLYRRHGTIKTSRWSDALAIVQIKILTPLLWQWWQLKWATYWSPTLTMMTTPISEILHSYTGNGDNSNKRNKHPFTGNDDNSNERNIAALHWQGWQLQWAKYCSFTLAMMTTPMSEIFSNRT